MKLMNWDLKGTRKRQNAAKKQVFDVCISKAIMLKYRTIISNTALG